MTKAELQSHITSQNHSQNGSSYAQRWVRPRDYELLRALIDKDGLVFMYNHQFDDNALLKCITQKTCYILVSSTYEDILYNALITIAGPAGENYCAFNQEMFNEMLRECFRELYPPFATPT